MRFRAFRVIGVTGLLLLAVAALAPAYGGSTLTLENQSGEAALVRLAGPTSGYVEVANATSRTIRISAGYYRLYVRYGRPGAYSYTRCDPFVVNETATEYEEHSITLHKVRNGNYGSRPSDETEFNGSR